MKTFFLLFVLLSALSVALGASVNDLYTTTSTGDLTYYGTTDAGNCAIVPRPSFVSDMTFTAALNHDQYVSDDYCAGCGVCIRGTYLNTGSGANPPPSTFSILIIDQCPECSSGDIDIATSGDGRWGISWNAIDCPVGDTKIQWQFEGSNSYYLKLGVRNHRIAVTKLEIEPFGEYVTIYRKDGDNFFIYSSDNGPISFPLNVRVTGVNGQVLYDVIPALVTSNNSPFTGSNKVQFDSYRPDGASGVVTTKASSSSSSTTKATATTKVGATTTAGATTKASGTSGNDGGSDGGSSSCFAASSLVRVMNPAGEVSSKALSDVRAGDLIESVDDALQRVFSPVYYVAHRQETQPVRLVELAHSEGQSLKLTPNHLLFAADNLLQQPVLQHARDLKEGQFLFALSAADAGEQARPVRIDGVKETWEAVRSPLTDNHRIVVSGVACSVFVESDGVYSALAAPIKALAHAFPSLLQEQSWFTLALDLVVRFTDSIEVAVAALLQPSASN